MDTNVELCRISDTATVGDEPVSETLRLDPPENTPSDAEFLIWVANRLVLQHGEQLYSPHLKRLIMIASKLGRLEGGK